MKYLVPLIMFLLFISLASAIPVSDVKLTGYVNDYTNTIKEEDIQIINDLASSLKNAGAAEVAIVIVDSLDGLAKEEYAIQIAHKNLGDTQKDNGLLILIALQEREYRIEVGYGLEGVLNDAKVGRIARETIVTNFKEGDYGWGIIQFLATVHLELLPDQEETIPVNYVDTGNDRKSTFFIEFIIIILFIFLRLVFPFIFNLKNQKSKRNNEDYLQSAILATLFFRVGKGGFGGSSFSGGGSSGGFGGGSFGGGGAGGHW